MAKKQAYIRGNKRDKVIIIRYESPLYNIAHTEKLEGECSSLLRDRRKVQPVTIIRIDSRLNGQHRLEVTLHEFFHRAAEEVFGYQGDEDWITPEMEELAAKYMTYLKEHTTKENIRSLKCVKRKKRDRKT